MRVFPANPSASAVHSFGRLEKNSSQSRREKKKEEERNARRRRANDFCDPFVLLWAPNFYFFVSFLLLTTPQFVF